MRAAMVVVSILLPATLSAQRLPMPVIPRPAVPAPLPPQVTPVAQDLAYKRLRVSVETYPVVSFVRTPGYASSGAFPNWWTFGTGTRADYRLTRYMSATLDMTSSFLGGPALVETAEAGTRVARPRDSGRLSPFADLRFGYIATFTKNTAAYDGIYGGLVACNRISGCSDPVFDVGVGPLNRLAGLVMCADVVHELAP